LHLKQLSRKFAIDAFDEWIYSFWHLITPPLLSFCSQILIQLAWSKNNVNLTHLMLNGLGFMVHDSILNIPVRFFNDQQKHPWHLMPVFSPVIGCPVPVGAVFLLVTEPLAVS